MCLPPTNRTAHLVRDHALKCAALWWQISNPYQVSAVVTEQFVAPTCAAMRCNADQMAALRDEMQGYHNESVAQVSALSSDAGRYHLESVEHDHLMHQQLDEATKILLALRQEHAEAVERQKQMEATAEEQRNFIIAKARQQRQWFEATLEELQKAAAKDDPQIKTLIGMMTTHAEVTCTSRATAEQVKPPTAPAARRR